MLLQNMIKMIAKGKGTTDDKRLNDYMRIRLLKKFKKQKTLERRCGIR